MQPHAHRIRSRRARWTVLLLFLFLHKYTLFTRINKKKPGHPTYDIKSYTAHGPWCMEHGLTHTQGDRRTVRTPTVVPAPATSVQ